MSYGVDQRIRIVLTSKWAGWVGGNYWSLSGEAWGEVKVDQTPVLFSDGRTVFPAQARVQSEAGADAPIVSEVGIGKVGSEIFIGIAEGDGTGVGDAE